MTFEILIVAFLSWLLPWTIIVPTGLWLHGVLNDRNA